MNRANKILSMAIELNAKRNSGNNEKNDQIRENTDLVKENPPIEEQQTLLDLIENADEELKDPNYVPSDNESISSSLLSEETKSAGKFLESQFLMEIDDSIRENQQLEFDENSDISRIKENQKGRKIKRNAGKQYITKSGKLVGHRKVKKLEDCRKKCNLKISFEAQSEIFQNYWALGSQQLRQSYVSGLIDVQDKKFARQEKSTSKPRNRDKTNYYYLDIRGEKISVCQKCFRYTFCETEQFIKTTVKKKLESSGPTTSADGRGRHTNHKKVSPNVQSEIIDFIKSFPAYESHYTRRDTSKRYLVSDLSISEMHKLHCDKLYSTHVSITKFAEIFHSLNLSFKKPKADTCHKCDVLKMKIDIATEQEKEDLKTQHEEHLKAADAAYLSKSKDKEKSIQDPTIKTFAFDLEQCLPTPFLQSSVSFYKRPLWTFNLTVHNFSTGQPICYMWHEAIARRGGNEIASCLYQYLKTLSSVTNHIIFYSHCCAGQNKNAFVATMFQLFMQEEHSVDTIDHKFLVPGHTHMECDVDHSIIERKKKKTSMKIHHPRDWYQFVRSAGVKNKFIVFEMTQNHFMNFSLLSKQKFMWRKVDNNGKAFYWKDIRWLRYTKQFGTILFKTSFNENEAFQVLNLHRRGINSISETDLQKSYNCDVPISIKKKKDLLDMIPLIDECYHSFYENLKTEDILDFHPDLTEENDE